MPPTLRQGILPCAFTRHGLCSAVDANQTGLRKSFEFPLRRVQHLLESRDDARRTRWI